MTIFRHDQHAATVAVIEEFWSHRMVREAQSIGPHRLELLHAIFKDAIRQGHAQPGEILVVASAFDFDGLAIQEKSEVRIKTDSADAESGGDLIYYLSTNQHAGPEMI